MRVFDVAPSDFRLCVDGVIQVSEVTGHVIFDGTFPGSSK